MLVTTFFFRYDIYNFDKIIGFGDRTTKPNTPANTTKCNGESQANVSVSSAVELVHPDVVGDCDHPGQLCRLCALPRQAMVYVFSETGLQLGLCSNTWLPTHVSLLSVQC
jgi:hypothetical protein